MQDKIFIWIAAGTVAILSIPFVMTQLGDKVKGNGWYWTFGDFLVMGALLVGSGSIFVLFARKYRKNRLAIGLLILALVLLTWAHLAVGIVDTWPFAGS